MNQFQELYKIKRVHVENFKSKHTNYLNSRRAKRSEAFDFRRGIVFEDTLPAEDNKTTKVSVSKNKITKCIKKNISIKRQPPPFVVGKVRHKIHSPPFLNGPKESAETRKRTPLTSIQSFAPKNYKFNVNYILKDPTLKVKKTPASPFLRKGLWSKTNKIKSCESKENIFDNVTVRSRNRHKVHDSPTTSLKQEGNKTNNLGCIRKTLDFDPIPIFGRLNLELNELNKNLISNELSDVNNAITGDKVRFTYLENQNKCGNQNEISPILSGTSNNIISSTPIVLNYYQTNFYTTPQPNLGSHNSENKNVTINGTPNSLNQTVFNLISKIDSIKKQEFGTTLQTNTDCLPQLPDITSPIDSVHESIKYKNVKTTQLKELSSKKTESNPVRVITMQQQDIVTPCINTSYDFVQTHSPIGKTRENSLAENTLAGTVCSQSVTPNLEIGRLDSPQDDNDSNDINDDVTVEKSKENTESKSSPALPFSFKHDSLSNDLKSEIGILTEKKSVKILSQSEKSISSCINTSYNDLQAHSSIDTFGIRENSLSESTQAGTVRSQSMVTPEHEINLLDLPKDANDSNDITVEKLEKNNETNSSPVLPLIFMYDSSSNANDLQSEIGTPTEKKSPDTISLSATFFNRHINTSYDVLQTHSQIDKVGNRENSLSENTQQSPVRFQPLVTPELEINLLVSPQNDNDSNILNDDIIVKKLIKNHETNSSPALPLNFKYDSSSNGNDPQSAIGTPSEKKSPDILSLGETFFERYINSSYDVLQTQSQIDKLGIREISLSENTQEGTVCLQSVVTPKLEINSLYLLQDDNVANDINDDITVEKLDKNNVSNSSLALSLIIKHGSPGNNQLEIGAPAEDRALKTISLGETSFETLEKHSETISSPAMSLTLKRGSPCNDLQSEGEPSSGNCINSSYDVLQTDSKIDKFKIRKNSLSENTQTNTICSQSVVVPQLVISMLDSPQENSSGTISLKKCNDYRDAYKSPIYCLKHSNVGLSQKSGIETIDLLSDDERPNIELCQKNGIETIDLLSDDEDSTLANILKKYSAVATPSPKSKRIFTSIENLPKIYVSPIKSPPLLIDSKKNSPQHVAINPLKTISLRNRLVDVTPSPKKRTPKKKNATPLKSPRLPICSKANSPNHIKTSPLKTISLRHRLVDVTPSPKKRTPKKKQVTPHNAEINSPHQIESPLRVLCLRKRKVVVTPSPSKLTPRGKIKEDLQRI